MGYATQGFMPPQGGQTVPDWFSVMSQGLDFGQALASGLDGPAGDEARAGADAARQQAELSARRRERLGREEADERREQAQRQIGRMAALQAVGGISGAGSPLLVAEARKAQGAQAASDAQAEAETDAELERARGEEQAQSLLSRVSRGGDLDAIFNTGRSLLSQGGRVFY